MRPELKRTHSFSIFYNLSTFVEYNYSTKVEKEALI